MHKEEVFMSPTSRRDPTFGVARALISSLGFRVQGLGYIRVYRV